jgi:hypothetical protein
VQRVATASRRLLISAFALASLALPAAAAGDSGRSITYTLTGTAGANGWYTTNVHVAWTVTPPPETETPGCLPTTLTSDTAGTQLTCSATWINPDEAQTRSVTVKIDKTAPTVTATPSRPPDANGWYTKPVTISFSGTDATSGLGACSSATYSGPDNGSASVAGTCGDNAGNVGTATFAFHYDATPPTLGKVTVAHGNRTATLKWKASPDAQLFALDRSPGVGHAAKSEVYRGAAAAFRDKGLRAGVKYRYTLTAFDAASNAAAESIKVTGTGALIEPLPGEHVKSAPLLVWEPRKRASYYNVQVFRGGRQIFTAWPTHTSLKLSRSWVFHGHRYRLRAGLYSWYVWPGFGNFAQAHYGKRLGGSTFFFGR